jgi:hypothetical protein
MGHLQVRISKIINRKIIHGGTNLVKIIDNVDKPGIFKLLSQHRGDANLPAKPNTGIVDSGTPVAKLVDALMRTIVRGNHALKLLQLDPTTRLQMRMNSTQQLRPVTNTTTHGTPMDEVKRLERRICPLALDIVDKELAVCRRPDGLDRAQVGAEHFGARELFGDVEGPVGCACAKVKDALDFWLVEWCAVQATVEQVFPEAVHQVEPVLFAFVVGEGILALAVCMVSQPQF